MQKLLIISNSILLLVSTLLFGSIHKLHDHDHNSLEIRCEECIVIDQANSYVFITQEEVIWLKSNTNKFEFIEINPIEFKAEKKVHSRAPPVS